MSLYVPLDRLSRRAFARLTILAASGLALLPGCRSPSAGADSAPPDSLLGKWRRLGRVWRELGALQGPERVNRPRRQAFTRLRAEMTEALGALPAWPELRVVFEQRAETIDTSIAMEEAAQRGVTCYEIALLGPDLAVPDVEGQVRELEALVKEGKLTKEAAEKAAASLAAQAEYMARSAEATVPSPERSGEEQARLQRAYLDHKLKPGPRALLAGKRLTEFTVDKVGWLAGPPKEGEGTSQAATDSPR